MNEEYRNLMVQQNPSKEADTVFYELLENGAQKKRIPAWKVAVVAACICLIIPGCVWAAETLFGVSKVTVCERPIPETNLPGIGMDIQYEHIENYELKDFPKHLRQLEEGEIRLHTSMKEVEDYLGLDLLENTVLSAEDTHLVGAFDEPGKNFQTFCGVWDGHLLFTEVLSVYKRNNVRFKMTVMASVAHPTIEEDYHSTNITYLDERDREILSEQYVTKAGIPALIVTVTENDHTRADHRAILDCFAFFAVDNISYKIDVSGWFFDSYDLEKYESPDEKVMDTLKEILDGYVLE